MALKEEVDVAKAEARAPAPVVVEKLKSVRVAKKGLIEAMS